MLFRLYNLFFEMRAQDFNWDEFEYPIESLKEYNGDWKFGPVMDEEEIYEKKKEDELLMCEKFETVYLFQVGEKDGDPWIFFVKHQNGYYIYFYASCDYTGFDCQGGGTVEYGLSWKNMWNFGLTDEVREMVEHEEWYKSRLACSAAIVALQGCRQRRYKEFRDVWGIIVNFVWEKRCNFYDNLKEESNRKRLGNGA